MKKKIKMNVWIIVGIFLTAIGSLFIYYGASISSKEDKDEIIKKIEEIPKEKIDIIKDNNYDGYGVSFILKIDKIDEARRKYIADIGDDPKRNRISLYLDNKNNLVYRIIDAESEVHSIKIPNNIHTFQLNTWYFIYFDYGFSDEFSFMRLYINDRLVGDKFFRYNLNLPVQIDPNQILLMADIEKKYFAKFTISFFATSHKTFTEKQIKATMNALFNFLQKIDAFNQ